MFSMWNDYSLEKLIVFIENIIKWNEIALE
jgi:hypothetical protein